MSNLNQFAISGRLTRDVELKALPSGTEVAEMGIAVNRDRKNGEEWVEETSFFELRLFGNRAGTAARKLSKGSVVTAAGRIEQQRWETPEGENRSKVVLIVTSIEGPDFFKSRDEDNAVAAVSEGGYPLSTADASDDDIPF
jgi:single-strand DNA-binding protein